MNLLTRIFPKGSTESELWKLHKDFYIRRTPWYFNQKFNILTDSNINIKIRFGFDDPTLLNDCPFMAKISSNLDDQITHKYIWFAYGDEKNKSDLVKWAKKFPYSELINNLDRNGISTSKSIITTLNENN